MRKRRFLGALVGFALAMGMMMAMSVTAHAAEYQLWVAGTQVTDENADDVLGNGAASYDADSATLTLNGLEYEGLGHEPSAIYASQDLTIRLEGDNVLNASGSSGDDSYGCAIQVDANDPLSLTIEGNGRLSASGGGYGIYVYGDLTIDGGTVVASGKSFSGIQGNGVTINGGTVIANGEGESAIFAQGSLTINGGAMTATNANYGVECYGCTAIKGGTVTVIGTNKAIYGNVENAVAGLGWTNAKGTEGKTAIPVSTAARKLDCKKAHFPAAAAKVTAPTAKNPTYNGSTQALVNAGKVEGGTMQYALGKDASTAPTSGWGASIPKATNAGTYYVWYKAIGDAAHFDSESASVKSTIAAVSIAKAKVTLTKASAAYNGKTQKGAVKSVVFGGKTLKPGTDYTVSAKSGKNAGSYAVTVTGKGSYTGTAKATYKIVKAANTVKYAKAKQSKSYKASDLMKAAKSFTAKPDKAQGTLSYTASINSSAKKVLSLNKKSGMVTVKKATKKGTYKVTIIAKAAGNANYKEGTTKTTVTVTVK